MSECIAMFVGFVCGAACVLVTGWIVGADSIRPRCSDKETEKRADDIRPYNGREQLQKQWENFLNYDGTEKGQVEIGEDELCRGL
ncbi:MAG: hypothetical protein E7473_06225 [Ruminococcaceae bacterium]|nr:hypothetical protein [Oscillospiraceae bacterium]